MLAGVSVSWYTWLEQGRNINISSDVLASIGEALQLDAGELRYLFRLAGLRSETQPPQPYSGSSLGVAEMRQTQELIDGWLPNPAFVRDRFWNVVVANEAAIAQLNMQPGRQNLLEDIFIVDGPPSRYPQGANLERRYAAALRVDVSQHLQDKQLSRLIADLAANSATFQEIWESHEILEADRPYGVRVELPGSLSQFFVRQLLIDRDHGVWMVVLLPATAETSPFSSHQLVGVM